MKGEDKNQEKKMEFTKGKWKKGNCLSRECTYCSRYPDEDAGNPFESNQGSNSRPQFPLTPAAIINGSAMTRDEMARREEEEEVERIRSNIGTKTVSTALLQALMP